MASAETVPVEWIGGPFDGDVSYLERPLPAEVNRALPPGRPSVADYHHPAGDEPLAVVMTYRYLLAFNDGDGRPGYVWETLVVRAQARRRSR